TGSGAVIFLDEKLNDKVSQTTADARYPLKVQIQTNALIYAVSAGSSNAYTASITPAITAYNPTLEVLIKANHTNTGAATLALNGLTAKSIKLIDGHDTIAGQMTEDNIYRLTYNDTL